MRGIELSATLHGGVVIGNHIRIPIGTIHVVGADPASIAPGGPTTARPQIRGNHRKGAVGVLRVFAQRDEMPAEEGLDVKVIGGRRHEEFRVTGPAHALIALRTVGGDFEIVAFLSPDDVAEKLVHQRTGTGEDPGLGHIGIHHDARHRTERGRHRQSPHFDITETVEGEARFEHHCAVGGKSVEVGRVRAAQVGGVNRTVRIEHFAMPHRDAIPNTAAYIQPYPADHVLAEIKSIAAGVWHSEMGGRQSLQTPRGLRDGGLDLNPADAGKRGRIAVECLDDG